MSEKSIHPCGTCDEPGRLNGSEVYGYWIRPCRMTHCEQYRPQGRPSSCRTGLHQIPEGAIDEWNVRAIDA